MTSVSVIESFGSAGVQITSSPSRPSEETPPSSDSRRAAASGDSTAPKLGERRARRDDQRHDDQLERLLALLGGGVGARGPAVGDAHPFDLEARPLRQRHAVHRGLGVGQAHRPARLGGRVADRVLLAQELERRLLQQRREPRLAGGVALGGEPGQAVLDAARRAPERELQLVEVGAPRHDRRRVVVPVVASSRRRRPGHGWRGPRARRPRSPTPITTMAITRAEQAEAAAVPVAAPAPAEAREDVDARPAAAVVVGPAARVAARAR